MWKSYQMSIILFDFFKNSFKTSQIHIGKIRADSSLFSYEKYKTNNEFTLLSVTEIKSDFPKYGISNKAITRKDTLESQFKDMAINLTRINQI